MKERKDEVRAKARAQAKAGGIYQIFIESLNSFVRSSAPARRGDSFRDPVLGQCPFDELRNVGLSKAHLLKTIGNIELSHQVNQ